MRRACACGSALAVALVSMGGPGVRVDGAIQSRVPAAAAQDAEFATFFGGSGLFDRVTGVGATFDTIVIAGDTTSSDLPTTTAAWQPAKSGRRDGFVAALSRSTGALKWATFLGGSEDESVAGIELGADGGIHVVGTTWSPDFPATWRMGAGGGGDAFVAGLSADGSTLRYAVVAGGAELDAGGALSGLSGVMWAVGETRSPGWPADDGAGDNAPPDADVLVLRIDPAHPAAGTAWAFGGSSTDRATAVAAAGQSLAIAGTTFSVDFGGARVASDADAFLAQWTPAGLQRVVRVGGTGNDTASGVVADARRAVLVGTTRSEDLPTTPGAAARYLRGPADAFAAAVAFDTGSVEWATYLGGPGHDGAAGAFGDAGTGVGLVGITTAGLPTSPQTPVFAGASDAFVASLGSDGGLQGALVLGGAGFDEGLAGAWVGGNSFVVAGATGSPDLATTPGAAMPTFPGGQESGFVAALSMPMVPPPVDRGPVVLVHGWLGLGTAGTRCSEGVTHHPESPTLGGYGGPSPGEVLDEAGFDVWYAHLESTAEGTPPITANARCLAGQLADVRRRRASTDPIALVGHSMGGVVARAYVEDDGLFAGDVSALVTLGAPHRGTPTDLPLALATFLHLGALGSCDRHPALCELTLSGAAALNRRYPARRAGVAYLAISGDLPPHEAGWLGRALGAWIAGPDDAVVPSASGTGLPGAGMIVTQEGHTGSAAGLPIAARSYFGPANGQWSSVPDCVAPFLSAGRCRGPEGETPTTGTDGFRGDSEGIGRFRDVGRVETAGGGDWVDGLDWSGGVTSSDAAHIPMTTVTIGAGEVVTRPLPLRAGQSALVAARWDRPGITLRVAAPGKMRGSAGASGAPGQDDGALGATAVVTATADGTWYINLAADSDGTARAASFAVITGGPALALEAPPVTAGGRITIAALPNGFAATGGYAVFIQPGGSVVTGTLSARGDGTLETDLMAGGTPGLGVLRAVVTGTDGNQPVEREASASLAVGSRRLRLAGTYADRVVDANGDGRYEALLVDVGIISDEPGDGAVVLEVRRALDPQGAAPITTAAANFAAPAGAYTATVRVDGAALAGARYGAFAIRNIGLEDLTAHGAVPAQQSAGGFDTSPYDTGAFGPPRRLFVPVTLQPLAR